MERREMLAAGVAGLAVLGAGTAVAQEKKEPKEGHAAAAGGPPLSADTAALLLVDHQVGLFSLVQDYGPDEFRNNVLALADIAKIFKLPTILTTSFETGPNGVIMPELKEMFPDAPFIPRPGQINAWDNEDFVKAVKKTGRKQLIIAGVVTDVCVAFPALSALKEGYQVFVVADASGTFNKQVADAALMRMAHAGAVITNWFAVACELQRDWRNERRGAGQPAGQPPARLQEPDHDPQRPTPRSRRGTSWTRRRRGGTSSRRGPPAADVRVRRRRARLRSRTRPPTSSSPTAGSPRSTSAGRPRSAVAIKGGRFVAVGDDKDVLTHRGDKTQVDRPAEANRHPRPERLPPPPDPRRAQLQPGAALGRRAVAGRRPADAHASRPSARRRRSGSASSAAGPSSSSPSGGCRRWTRSTPPPPTRRSSSCTSTTGPWLNKAALRAVGYTKDTPDPPGGEIQRDKQGNPTGLLIARPNAKILYDTLAKGPKLAARGSGQLDPALHARDEPPRHHELHRRRRRLPELPRRLPGHRAISPRRAS